jgi:hypothetical protein
MCFAYISEQTATLVTNLYNLDEKYLLGCTNWVFNLLKPSGNFTYDQVQH